jgi:hypothetical protein
MSFGHSKKTIQGLAEHRLGLKTGVIVEFDAPGAVNQRSV